MPRSYIPIAQSNSCRKFEKSTDAIRPNSCKRCGRTPEAHEENLRDLIEPPEERAKKFLESKKLLNCPQTDLYMAVLVEYIKDSEGIW